MKQSRRLVNFVILNILVSAFTTWLVVSVMLRQNFIIVPDAGPAPTQAHIAEDPEDNGSDSGNSSSAQYKGLLEIDTIIGSGDIDNERVLVKYTGSEELSLAGWQLQDENGNTFTFPGLTMFSGGAVTVYTSFGVNTVVELYWGLDTSVWQSGETATLLDPAGKPQATFRIP
ncbi:MAG: lamin tail domain-containing protein [Anaerolineae bacterium]|nr:lamin tail domain-containing protein [Anaerolineae bacterium]